MSNTAQACYAAIWKIKNIQGVIKTVRVYDIAEPNSGINIKITNLWYICCDQPPKNFPLDKIQHIKNFIKDKCEEISTTENIDPATSPLLKQLLEWFTANENSVNLGLRGGQALPNFTKTLREQFLNNFNKIEILEIKFEKMRTNTNLGPGGDQNPDLAIFYCDCETVSENQNNDAFAKGLAQFLCDGPPPDPPLNNDETIGEPNIPTQRPENPAPVSSIILGTTKEFSNECFAQNKTKIISEVAINIVTLLRPDPDDNANKLETFLKADYLQLDDDKKNAFIKSFKPSATITQNSPKISSVAPRDIIPKAMMDNSTTAEVSIYEFPTNTTIASSQDVAVFNKNEYSKYSNIINIKVPPNTPNEPDRNFIPKKLNLEFYKNRLTQKNLEKADIYVYKDEEVQAGDPNENKIYSLRPKDVITVPIELCAEFSWNINCDSVTIPFIINSPVSTTTLEPCEEKIDNTTIELTKKTKDINNNLYELQCKVFTTVFISYKILKNLQGKNPTTIIKRYNFQPEIANFVTTLGSEDPIYHIKFAKETKEEEIKNFANAIASNSAFGLAVTELIDRYVIFEDDTYKYLAFKNTGQNIKNIILAIQSQLNINSLNIFVPSDNNEIRVATISNLNDWVNVKCQPKVEYTISAEYVVVGVGNGGGVYVDRNTIFSINDQIINNLNDANKFRVEIDNSSIGLKHSSILTQQALDKIQKQLEKKTNYTTECCCYHWIIGYRNADDSKNLYVPKRNITFIRKIIPKN